MDAIELSKRELHLENARKLFSQVTTVQELDDGYSFCLPAELVGEVAEFVALERLCCPFFGFIIEIEPESGPMWLHLTGREGVKEFIQTEISQIVENAGLFSSLKRG